MNIVLGISASIAAYKSPDLVRRLQEYGATVRVVMTPGATEFISPLTLQAVSHYPVIYDIYNTSHEAGMGHIELARWADAVVIAPCSANTLAKLAHGMADNLLTALCLATEKPLWLAPAMNRLMWHNPATQSNCSILKSRGIQFIGPGNGEQACGEVGDGRLTEPQLIAAALHHALNKNKEGLLQGKRIVITAGATQERIDPVRYITNKSSGKMGYALAEAAYAQGAEVTLISGKTHLSVPAGVQCITVETALEMHEAVMQKIDYMDIFIGTAAIADFRPINIEKHKLKKEKHIDTLTLNLVKNPDIIASVAAHVHRPFCVGFAAETDHLIHYAKQKLIDKKLDMICANDVSNNQVFDRNNNQVIVLTKKDNKVIELPSAKKIIIAQQIIQIISEQYINS